MNASEMRGYKRGQRDEQKRCAECVPTTWLDPLLTGPEAVIGRAPYTSSEVEALLRAVKQRIQKP